MTCLHIESQKSGVNFTKKDCATCGNQQEMLDKMVTLFFDGSYRRGSKEGSVGFVVYDVHRKKVCAEHVQDGKIYSNNEAEYCGLYMGLQRCVKMGY